MRAETELEFENYESVQYRLQFSGIKKGAKSSFHRHFNFTLNGKLTDKIDFLSLVFLLFVFVRSTATSFKVWAFENLMHSIDSSVNAMSKLG